MLGCNAATLSDFLGIVSLAGSRIAVSPPICMVLMWLRQWFVLEGIVNAVGITVVVT
jgi:hypothetical protein